MAYPDGQPGFYFVRMRYADNVDTIFAAERQARQVLQEDSATLAACRREILSHAGSLCYTSTYDENIQNC